MAGASLSSRRSRLLGLGGFLGHGAGEVDGTAAGGSGPGYGSRRHQTTIQDC